MQIWVCSKTRWLRFCQYGSIYCSLILVENVARVLLQVSFHLASEPEMVLESFVPEASTISNTNFFVS